MRIELFAAALCWGAMLSTTVHGADLTHAPAPIPATSAQLRDFRASIETELKRNILGFWAAHAVEESSGGFVGAMSNTNVVDPESPKSLVLNTRLLWTFSTAFRVTGEERYRTLAERAYDYLNAHFIDREHGGLYFMVDHTGKPTETKKRMYGQAFSVYAFAEYHRATGDAAALERAKEVYVLIEKHARDADHLGYMETCERDWSLAEEQALSAGSVVADKSMNTHLHMLEAYSGLYRVWPDPVLRQRLTELVEIFLDHIIDAETHHFILFFDKEWTPQGDTESYGHDIEGSWLLSEAVELLDDPALSARANAASLAIAKATIEDGLEADGGLLYEAEPGGAVNSDRHWWPMAEAVVGFLNAYQLSGDEAYLNATLKCWAYTQEHLINKEHGEWYWRVSKAGVPYTNEPKISPWKAPYHNGRMCFEVLRRITAP